MCVCKQFIFILTKKLLINNTNNIEFINLFKLDYIAIDLSLILQYQGIFNYITI